MHSKTLSTLNKVIIKCTVHYIVHLQCTLSRSLSPSLTYESKGFWHFSLILKRQLSNEKIQYLYCTVSCTVSRDDRTIKIMLFHQSAAQAMKKRVIFKFLHGSYQKFCVWFYCNNKIQDNNNTDIPECLHKCPLLNVLTSTVNTLFPSVW